MWIVYPLVLLWYLPSLIMFWKLHPRMFDMLAFNTIALCIFPLAPMLWPQMMGEALRK